MSNVVRLRPRTVADEKVSQLLIKAAMSDASMTPRERLLQVIRVAAAWGWEDVDGAFRDAIDDALTTERSR